MLRNSKNVSIKMHSIPDTAKFTIAMHPEREILAIVTDPATSQRQFLVHEPEGESKRDFSFQMVKVGVAFNKPNSWEYLGEAYIVEDPTSDRPFATTHYVYGERTGQWMGGAL